MKKFFTFVLLAAFLPLAVFASADEKAVLFVKELTDNVITNVLESKENQEKKEADFKKYFTQALDLPSIGRFVLGRYWKSADKQQRDDFIQIFMDATAKSWADRFNLYTGQQLEFLGSRFMNNNPNQIYVDSKIMDKKSPVEVIWRLQKKQDSYKIIDIIIENVSMALTYRNEYNAFLQSHNGDIAALINQIRQKGADAREDKIN
jgi:phospholipid transport system substrate-binding protein